jgi:hypothetical protein
LFTDGNSIFIPECIFIFRETRSRSLECYLQRRVYTEKIAISKAEALFIWNLQNSAPKFIQADVI